MNHYVDGANPEPRPLLNLPTGCSPHSSPLIALPGRFISVSLVIISLATLSVAGLGIGLLNDPALVNFYNRQRQKLCAFRVRATKLEFSLLLRLNVAENG